MRITEITKEQFEERAGTKVPFRGLTDEEAKIRTYRNLVPAYRNHIAGNNDIILKAEHKNRNWARQIKEMTTFLSERGENPLTMAEWAKAVNGE